MRSLRGDSQDMESVARVRSRSGCRRDLLLGGEIVMIPKPVQKKIDAQVLDSAEWFGSHMGIKYKGAQDCEKCFLGGIAFVVAAMNGTTQPEEFQKMLKTIQSLPAPSQKKKVVRRRSDAAPKKRVVRRKK